MSSKRKFQRQKKKKAEKEVKQALDKAGTDTFGGWNEETDGSQTISQEMFVYPLIKAVQELSAKNDALEARIITLEG